MDFSTLPPPETGFEASKKVPKPLVEVQNQFRSCMNESLENISVKMDDIVKANIKDPSKADYISKSVYSIYHNGFRCKRENAITRVTNLLEEKNFSKISTIIENKENLLTDGTYRPSGDIEGVTKNKILASGDEVLDLEPTLVKLRAEVADLKDVFAAKL